MVELKAKPMTSQSYDTILVIVEFLGLFFT
jgi:hypothetical protein